MFEAGALIFRIQTMGKEVFHKDLQDADKAVEKAGTTAKTTGKATEELGAKQETAGKKTRESSKATEELGKKQSETTKQTEKATKATETQGKALVGMSEDAKRASREVGQAAVGVGAAFVAVAGLSAKAAIDWESSWAGVTKTVNGTPEELQAIEDGLRGLTKVLPGSHDEIAAVAEAAGQLGVKSSSVVAFTKTMVDLGETTNLSSDEAATAIAQLMNIMQTAPKDVDRLGSSLVALGNDGASTEKDIILMAQRIASAGKIIGLTEGEVLGFANALASVGIEVEAGGSAISRIMVDIAKEVSTNGENLEKWASVAGLSAADFAKSFKEDPAQAIATFISGLGKMNDAGGDVFTTLDELGQSDIRVSNALLSMANSGDLLTKSLKLGNQSWEDNNALQTEAEKRYATTAAKIEIAKNNINDAAISFGDVFLPALVEASQGVADFAGFISGLPAPLKETFSSAGLLAGGVLVMGGTMLLAVPRVIELVSSVRTLMETNTAATAKMKGFATFMSGPWGVGLLAGAVVVSLLEGHLESLKSTSEEVENSLTTAKTAADIFDTVGKGREVSAWRDVTADLENMSAMLDKVSDQDDNIFLRFSTETIGFRNALRDTGTQLGGLAATDLPGAQKAFALLAAETDGSVKQKKKLLDQMGPYRDALVKEAGQLGINVTTEDEALNTKRLLKLATGDAAEGTKVATEATIAAAAATEAATKAQEEWNEMIAESDSAFVDLQGGYDDIIQKNQDAAQATADSTESSSDSWKDYYDGFTVGLDNYLTELQAQVDAQNNWESNMVLLSGKVSQGVLDELAKMGPEGAPLVADLVNASGEELAKLEGIVAERSEAATGAFAQKLRDSQTVINAAAAQLGQDAANEIAAKLAAGTATVGQIVDEYGLKVAGMNPTLNVNTSAAHAKIDALMARLNGGDAIAFGAGYVRGDGIAQADGGKVNFYANGGRENHIAQFARAGTMRVWAEPETGGEWYIPASPAKRGRSTMLLGQAADEFGYQLVPKGTQSFADGGRAGATVTTEGGDTYIQVDIHLPPGPDVESQAKIIRRELGELAGAKK